MAKTIKNYTSAVPVERTIASIEQELVKIGVTQIVKSYDSEGLPMGIIFSIQIPTVGFFNFKIPARVEAAHDLLKTIPMYKKKNKEWLKAQSRRTAWKIVLEWVAAQVAMVQLNNIDAMQMFLQFSYNPKTQETLYDRISGNGFRMLAE
jgi:hypothetical protein